MFKKPKALTALDTEITRIQSILKTKKPTEDDYATTLTQVERLFALENSHVITTKALSFAMRLK
jgi:hypothetical protein